MDPRPSVSIAVIIRRDLAPVAAHLRDELSGLTSVVSVIIDRRYRERRASLTRKRSLVQIQYSPASLELAISHRVIAYRKHMVGS